MKKTFQTIGWFFLFLVLLTGPFITVFLVSENHTFQDYRERAELAGTLDFLEVGASHCKRSFISSTIDEGLGVNSYNLGLENMTMQGRLELVKLELSRNPVKTVILELSMDSLNTDKYGEASLGDLYMIPKLGSVPRSLSYMVRSIRPWYWGTAYSFLLMYGIDDTRELLKGKFSWRNVNQKKGYVPYYDETELLKKRSLKLLKKIFGTKHRNITLRKSNEKYMRQLIEACQEKGAEVIFVTAPVSAYWLSRYDNLNDPYLYYRDIAEEYGVDYYDLNLWIGEYELFRDEEDFQSGGHLSNPGARKFTDLFVGLMQRRGQGEDVSQEFYTDYQDLYAHMPYAG